MTTPNTDEARELAVPDTLAGERLDRALARMFPEYSRTRLKDWLLEGFVTVNGTARRPRDVVTGGEVVRLQPQASLSVTSQPEPIDLDVVFEDDDLLVVNKPAGLVVHPGAGNLRGTLMNGLLHRVPALSDLPRAGIVHRLDKDTTGLLLIGKTLPAHTALVRQMAAREVSRHYLAVCVGVLTGGGTINAPIARHPVDRLRMSVQDDGKPAITHYRVIKRFAAHTYISVRLESGRTHQIRVHLAWRRHPLVGDQVYGGRLAIPAGAGPHLQEVLRGFRRQALHAAKLEFAHPVSGELLSLEAPVPADFARLLDALEEVPAK
ncbi:MAG TPA: 23S rRNA pseudouridine(1911/1915/1917) synthase RluD [Woeseiaceae bacterium]|nr:23S rRNA pseudouridine(1911/1915/1917) synthase RluD [Woeseiaceae bacterium]